jgi:hypothetical protein
MVTTILTDPTRCTHCGDEIRAVNDRDSAWALDDRLNVVIKVMHARCLRDRAYHARSSD